MNSAIIFAGTMERAQIVARELTLRRSEWRYGRNYEAIIGVRQPTRVIVADSFYNGYFDVIEYLKSRGIPYEYVEGH